jgi:hypothetical protein
VFGHFAAPAPPVIGSTWRHTPAHHDWTVSFDSAELSAILNAVADAMRQNEAGELVAKIDPGLTSLLVTAMK